MTKCVNPTPKPIFSNFCFLQSLFDNFIFSSLSEKELAIFVAAMEPVTVPAGEY